MLLRIWHGLLTIIAVAALPGIIVGVRLGVLETGLGIFVAIVAAFGILVNYRAFFHAHKDDTEVPIGITLFVGWFFFSIVAIPFGVGTNVWFELNSEYAYQYQRDYPIAHYVDPEHRFELDYPEEFDLLTAAEARVQLKDRFITVAPAAILFVGWGPDWVENINIQMSRASYRDGELIGDDENELRRAGTQLRKMLQQQYPDASVDRLIVEEIDDWQYLRIGMRRYNEVGIRIAQQMTTVIMDGRQVTFTTTTLPKTAAGLNRYRFATIIESFRVSTSDGAK